MPLPVIADTMRVSVEGLLSSGRAWANILHFRKSGIITYAAAVAILEARLPLFWTHRTVGAPGWGYYAHTGASIQRIRYTPLDGISPTTVAAHVSSGAAAADPLPAQDALAVTFYTASRGRRYRGRMFLAALTEGNNDSTGHASGGMLTDLSAEWQAVQTALVGTGVTQVVASYGVPDTAHPGGWAPFATDVVSFLINSRFDTIRRRAGR